MLRDENEIWIFEKIIKVPNTRWWEFVFTFTTGHRSLICKKNELLLELTNSTRTCLYSFYKQLNIDPYNCKLQWLASTSANNSCMPNDAILCLSYVLMFERKSNLNFEQKVPKTGIASAIHLKCNDNHHAWRYNCRPLIVAYFFMLSSHSGSFVSMLCFFHTSTCLSATFISLQWFNSQKWFLFTSNQIKCSFY